MRVANAPGILSGNVAKAGFTLALVLLVGWYLYRDAIWPSMADWKNYFGYGEILLIGIMLLVINLFVRGLRFVLLLSDTANPVLVFFGFGWTFIMIQFMPFRTGEVARLIWFSSKGIKPGRILQAIVFERAFDLIILIAMIVFIVVPSSDQNALFDDALTVSFSILMVCISCWYIVCVSSFFPRFIAPIGRRLPRLAAVIEEFRVFDLTTARMLVLTGISIAAWGIAVAAFTVLLSPLGDLSWHEAAICLVAVNLAGIATVAPGSIGVFEAAGLLALKSLGHEPGQALVVIVCLHALIIFSQLGFGLLSWAAVRLTAHR